MGDLQLIQLTNTDPRFYPLLGPFLARRDIVTALGGPLYDDPGTVWFVALGGEQVAGFGALRLEGESAHFCCDYVVPDYRRQGLHHRLLDERLAYVAGRAKRATATATLLGQFGYKSRGFVEVDGRRPMKNFVRLERSVK